MDFWAKILLFRTNHFKNSPTKLILRYMCMYYLVCAYTFLIINGKLIEACSLRKKVLKSGWVNCTSTFLYNNPHNIQYCFELMCFTYWIVFHLESSFCVRPIRLKLNQDLIAWRDMAGRNWITTILSHHGWCMYLNHRHKWSRIIA